MRTILALAFLLLAAAAGAQTPAADAQERKTIDLAKNVLASTLDPELPKVTLEYFLEYESEGATIKWEVNDCGEQTGDPAVDKNRDIPTCVEADVYLKDQRALNVFVAVGSVKKGNSSDPQLFSVTITETDGKTRSIRLRDVPAELHRTTPLRKKSTSKERVT